MLRPIILTGTLGLILGLVSACSDSRNEESGSSDTPKNLPGGFELAVSEKAQGSADNFVAGMDVQMIAAAAQNSDIWFIDVRTPEEFKTGHIPGAQHIPLDQFDPATLNLPADTSLVLYCRSGKRSAIAAQRLGEYLDDDVMHLEGGILAWQEAGQDVVILN